MYAIGFYYQFNYIFRLLFNNWIYQATHIIMYNHFSNHHRCSTRIDLFISIIHILYIHILNHNRWQSTNMISVGFTSAQRTTVKNKNNKIYHNILLLLFKSCLYNMAMCRMYLWLHNSRRLKLKTLIYMNANFMSRIFIIIV